MEIREVVFALLKLNNASLCYASTFACCCCKKEEEKMRDGKRESRGEEDYEGREVEIIGNNFPLFRCLHIIRFLASDVGNLFFSLSCCEWC
jgi:hypothetical protein